MKGLLHSKRFKRNLKRWICMYVGVLILFTSVVTYSKYISSFTVNTSATIPKFNVNINEKKVAVPNYNTDSAGNYYPTSVIPYQFQINTNIDVKTLLVLTVNAEEDFSIMTIKDISGNELFPRSEKAIDCKEPSDTCYIINNYTINRVGKSININKIIQSENDNISETFEVGLKYNYESNTYYQFNRDYLNNMKIVNIDYSAKQLLN